MIKTFVATTLLAAGLAVGAAQATTFDFEGGPGVGPIVGNEFGGVTLSTTNANGLALFNSNCGTDFPGTPCTGGDTDLATGPSFGTVPQGLVLINWDGDAADVGDDAAGGVISFDFLSPLFIKEIALIDIDENPAQLGLTFRLAGGGMSMFTGNDATSTIGSGNNSMTFFTGLENGLVLGLDIAFNKISGAVAYVETAPAPVPVPAALPMLISALGLTGWLARRRRAA